MQHYHESRFTAFKQAFQYVPAFITTIDHSNNFNT